MRKYFEKIDGKIIHFMRTIFPLMARLAIFIIFFWFGFLKIIDTSPANPMVAALLAKTLPFISFNQFIVLFGVYEMIIGLTFLIPGLERLAIALLVPHMITTFLPLVFLAPMTWQGFLTPTLEGQYIIKNLLIIALAMGVAAQLHPIHFSGRKK